MNKIYFTSDLHFGHDREFLYGKRGFSSITEHDSTVVTNWNEIVDDEDEVYILGDLMLNDNDNGMKLLNLLKGKKHIIIGNHDTSARIELYKTINGFVDIMYANRIRYGKYHFYLSHYPTVTDNGEDKLSQCIINLYGHTHQRENFYQSNPCMYHVGLDSHNNRPIEIEDIITEIKTFYREKKGL